MLNIKKEYTFFTVRIVAVTSMPWWFPRMLSTLSAHLTKKDWPLGAPGSDTGSSSKRVVKMAELGLFA